jgi:hypothetical protein
MILGCVACVTLAAPSRLRAVDLGSATRGETQMQSSRWTGWIAFGGFLMIIIGGLDFFEGLIAIIRGHYYVLTPSQVIVFDVSTWGWLTLLWGIVVAFAGWSLLQGAGWARWFTIVVASINVLGQLSFAGSAQFPLWSLTIVAFSVVVIYALIVHWGEVEAAA